MFKYASLDVENHYTPETYALSFAHRIGLEDEIVVSEFLYGPIERVIGTGKRMITIHQELRLYRRPIERFCFLYLEL